MDNQRVPEKSSSYYTNARPEMLDFVPSDASSILEVGCSSGYFGASLKQDRTDRSVWGIEPVRASAELASSRLDKVFCGTLETNWDELSKKRFDCIVFNDVLEHLVHPQTVLENAKHCLSPTGTVVASIPNILFFDVITKVLLTEDWKYEDEGILDRTHLRFFTKKSIVRMFETAGLTIDVIKGINAIMSRRYKVANLLTLGRVHDWRYLQFGVRASLTRHGGSDEIG